MLVKVKDGQRTIKLEASERRCLEKSQQICAEVNSLIDGRVSASAERAVNGITGVLADLGQPKEKESAEVEA